MEATQHWLTCPTPGIYALGQLTRKASVLTRERGHASSRIVTRDLWKRPICRYIRMLFRFLRPGLLVYWPSWLKALAVKLSRPSGQSGSYTGLIWFNPRWFIELKRGMSSTQRTSVRNLHLLLRFGWFYSVTGAQIWPSDCCSYVDTVAWQCPGTRRLTES